MYLTDELNEKNLCPDLICVIEKKTSTISNANVRENVHRM